MSTETIPSEIMHELRQAADRAAKGLRDPETMRQARKNIDRIREELFEQHGTLDIGLRAIRELRDS